MTPAPEAAAPELDERAITMVVDNVSDTLSIIAPGVPQLPEMAALVIAEVDRVCRRGQCQQAPRCDRSAHRQVGGITGVLLLATKLRNSPLPDCATPRHSERMPLLAGIALTVSLFNRGIVFGGTR